MTRRAVAFAWLIVAALLFTLGALRANAQTPQANYERNPSGFCSTTENGAATVTGQAGSICAGFGPYVSTCAGGASVSASVFNQSAMRCEVTVGTTLLTISVTATGTTSCPGGSTLVGGSCVCGTGTSWNGSTCASPTCNPGERGSWPSAKPAPGALPSSVCVGGCTMEPDFYGGDSSTGKFWGSGKNTGGNCTSADPPAGPTGCTETQCRAVINGANVCIACGAAGTSPEIIGGGQKVNPDGTATGQRKETVCKDGICTDTTVTQNYNADGTPNGEPTVENDTRKKAPGDDPMSDFCRTNPLASVCAYLGTASDTVEVPTQTNALSALTPVTVASSAGCPADVPLPHGTAYSWQPMCTLATGVRPVIIALAWLSAGLILLGGKIGG